MSIEKLKPHEKIKLWLSLLEDRDLIKRIRMAFEYFVDKCPGKIVNKNNVNYCALKYTASLRFKVRRCV